MGTLTTNLIGHFSGYGSVWYHPDGIANILLFSRVRDQFQVQYDQAGDAFNLFKPDGTTRSFKRSASGLYVSEATVGTVLVSTVAANKSNYTNADYERALLARKLQIILGHPSSRELQVLLEKRLLPNVVGPAPTSPLPVEVMA
jgi:hypothetical protein